MSRLQDTISDIPDLARQSLSARLQALAMQLRCTAALFDNSNFDKQEIAALLDAASISLDSSLEGDSLIFLSEQEIPAQQKQLPWISALLQGMADSSPVGYYVVDHHTDNILFANSRFYEIWGVKEFRSSIENGEFTHRQLLPALLRQLKEPKEALHCCQQVAHPEQRVSQQNEIRLADGRLIRQFSTQIHDRQGTYLGQVYDFFDITERKRLELESREQLRALTKRLNNIREEEQTRLARHIHDVLGHALAATKMDVAWLHRQLNGHQPGALSEAVNARFEAIFCGLDDTIAQVRQISAELRPALLDTLGLVEAVEWAAQQFVERSGINCQFSASGDVELSADDATTLFRICQELLTNIAQYSQADVVTISIEQSAEQLVLTVTDNGIGISPKAISAATSLGLIGIRERVLILNGEFTICGTPAQGTVATVLVPRQMKAKVNG